MLAVQRVRATLVRAGGEATAEARCRSVPPVPAVPLSWVFIRGLPGFAREGSPGCGLLCRAQGRRAAARGVSLSTASAAVARPTAPWRRRRGCLLLCSFCSGRRRTCSAQLRHGVPRPARARDVGLVHRFGWFVRATAGATAMVWYPFPDEVRRSREFKRVFDVESVVSGVIVAPKRHQACRAAQRLALARLLPCLVNLVTGASRRSSARRLVGLVRDTRLRADRRV